MKTKKSKIPARKSASRKRQTLSGSKPKSRVKDPGLPLVGENGRLFTSIKPLLFGRKSDGSSISIGVYETFDFESEFTIFEKRGAVTIGTDAGGEYPGEYLLFMENVPQVEGPPVIKVGYRYLLPKEYITARIHEGATDLQLVSQIYLNDIVVVAHGTAAATGRHFLKVAAPVISSDVTGSEIQEKVFKRYSIPIPLAAGEGYNWENRIDTRISIRQLEKLLDKFDKFVMEEGMHVTMGPEVQEFYCRLQLEQLKGYVNYPPIIAGPFYP